MVVFADKGKKAEPAEEPAEEVKSKPGPYRMLLVVAGLVIACVIAGLTGLVLSWFKA